MNRILDAIDSSGDISCPPSSFFCLNSLKYLFHNGLGAIIVFVKIIRISLFYGFLYGLSYDIHPNLALTLPLEVRIRKLDGYDGDHAFAAIIAFHVFLILDKLLADKILLNSIEDTHLESGFMVAAILRSHVIDERNKIGRKGIGINR